MPEGDTLHRIARTLTGAIGGRVVTRFETVLPQLARVDEDAPIAGRTVESVSARGKHLLVEFSGDLILHSHLRMNGSWHVYRPGEPWQRPRIDMRVVIGTSEWLAVGFNLPVAEFLTRHALARNEQLRRLGPDLASEGYDAIAGLERLRSLAASDIADALLNQTAVAGIGNVYKSELLFIRSIDPFRKVAELTDDQLQSLLTTAQRLLKHNVQRESGGRETRRGLQRDQELWVYGRRGKPCRRCGTAIEMRKQGRDARVTFWCPKCQK